jgi:hypothetical protein
VQQKIVKPLIDELNARLTPPVPPPVAPLPEPGPAELDQDPGSAYSPDHTYPQT